MKTLCMGALLSVLFFVSITTVEATQQHHNTPRPTPRVTVRPTETPRVTPQPTITVTIMPEATQSPTPSPSPIVDETVTPDPTQPPQARTDLSDGRSDGRTDSLDCLKRDCSGVAGQSAVLSAQRELPSTGDGQLVINVGIGIIGIVIGYILRKYSDRNNI